MQGYDIDFFENRVFEIEGLYSIEYKGYTMRPHRHAAIEITYVESGRCELNIHNPLNHSVINVPILSNNFIIINAGVYHDLYVDDDITCALKTIEFKAVEHASSKPFGLSLGQLLRCTLLVRNMLAQGQPYMVLCDTVQLSRVMTEIIYLHTRFQWNLPNDKYLLMQYKIGEFLLKVNDCMPVNDIGNVGVVYIKRAQHLIRERLLDADLTIDMIASEIGITKNYLMTLYQKHLGHTVLSEIQSLRVEQACSKILNTDEPLTDIGFACGFNTRQSFFSNFKKIMGMSPSRFRARNTRISIYSYAEIHSDEL